MTQDRQKRQYAERKGRLAETYAAAFLMTKGYKILDMRFKTYGGEIDIVARHKNTIVMVEVKARATAEIAQDAVTYQNRRRIEAATDIWISKHSKNNELGIRFDIVSVSGAKISHLKNAWLEGE